MQNQKGERPPSQLTAAALMLGALLPLGLSVCFHTLGPKAQPIAKAEERPGLVFDQYMVNLRDRVWPGERFIGAKFAFKNIGTQPVKFGKPKPSCGCLIPQLEKNVYKPGEIGEFYVRVETANEEPGPKEYFITIPYDDPKPREVELTFKVILPERQVVVRPRALIFSYRNSTEATTQDVVITNYRKKPFQITGIRSTSPLVTAELAQEGTDEFGNQQHHVTITVKGNVPPGIHWAKVIATTDDADYSEVVVPIRLQNRSAPATAEQIKTESRRRQ